MNGKLIRFGYDTHCFEISPHFGMVNCTVSAGSLGIVVCKSQPNGPDHGWTTYEVLVGDRILYNIEPDSLIVLKDKEC